VGWGQITNATTTRLAAWIGARVATVLLCCTLLVSCFVPDQYEAEIRLSRDGSYGITFIGILTYAPLFGQIARGQIDPEHAKENERMFLEQLKRDDAFKEVTSLGRGRYQVRYERTGRFAGSHQQVTFVSRQEPIFRIRTTEDGRVEVNGSGQGNRYAASLEEVGLKSQGLFRVVTDMDVTQQNAHFKRASPTPGYTMYDWRLRSFRDPPPHLEAKLAVDPRTGVPSYRGGKGDNVEPEDPKK
jgi:hypothetical protein